MFNFLLDIIFPKYCFGCNKEGSYWCLDCQAQPFKQWNGRLALVGDQYFSDFFCVGDYEDKTLGQLIKACKYRFVKELTASLGKLLAAELQKRNLSGTIVPVPLSKRRQQWRGFNQAAEISQIAATIINCPYQECLKRIKHKKAQAKLSEAKRLLNMKDCFLATAKVPQRVILIDDVVTTGATVNECAKILRQAGSQEIFVAALAKG